MMTEYTENDQELWDSLQSQIRENDLEIVFLKKDATERTMHCTLREDV